MDRLQLPCALAPLPLILGLAGCAKDDSSYADEGYYSTGQGGDTGGNAEAVGPISTAG